jgi:pyruvate carboxylase
VSIERPIKKVLAANRGEIAIRIFRACTEIGIRTVAIYSHEDLLAIHRYKADEAYLVGTKGDPIGAYLDVEGIISLAKAQGVDAIHPGYGFLSENVEFARRCEEEGIIFVGPRPDTLDVLADKTTARSLAQRVGVPVVPGSDSALMSEVELRAFGQQHGYPLILKAAFGGGGRGMRIVRHESEASEAYARAAGEAKSAFGRDELFCERYIEDAKHIEVQILGDRTGHCVHLFERDCSVQRRHQKVIEFAPSVTLSQSTREALFDASLRLAKGCNYENAGTVEFLVEPSGNFYFIEVNPRIQVEHTVTEIITGRDLVQCQLRIASGLALADPEIGIADQSAIEQRGYAIQCRITTEDPSANFAPDTGKISAYRAASGFGIRLDASTGGAGTIISSDYDSMIVKLTASGLTFDAAARKALRSLREFRIRGIKTNIQFLENAVTHPVFLSGQASTRFIDKTPELMEMRPRKDRATRLLRALASSVVNGPPNASKPFARPEPFFPPSPPKTTDEPLVMSPAMQAFKQGGAVGLSTWLRSQQRVQLTDTTFRDAHQSLLATRVRTRDLVAVGPATAKLCSELFSVEMWGGATFDVAYRFLKEDPWERLAALREVMPNLLFQMLLRGANAVGYTNYPDNVIREFVKESASAGVDIFRIFDALNWLPNMELAMEEVNKAGKIVEASICYTGDLSDPSEVKYDLRYYIDLAKAIEARGAHIIAIKDMAGLLKPQAARLLVTALRNEVGLPIHLHTHDTSGNGIAMLLAASEAGVDAIDCALSSMSGLTSQPSLNALVAAMDGDPRQPLADTRALQSLAEYWERVRDMYWPFESGLKASTAEVYEHQIPGGQYSNFRPRAIQLGLGGKWTELKAKYREVSDALGGLIKVTPTSKVVADFAMFLVQNDLSVAQCIERADRLDFPQSVTDFMAGRLGQPYQGIPYELQFAILKGIEPLKERAGLSLPDHDFGLAAERLRLELGQPPDRKALLSDALYPAVYKEYRHFRAEYGRIDILPTPAILYGLRIGEQINVTIEHGKTLVVKLMAVGGVSEAGYRSVYFELNGQPREISVPDNLASESLVLKPKADSSNPLHVGASMPGKITSLRCSVGQSVKAGEILLVSEAMKMETSLTAPSTGTVAEILIGEGEQVQGGDLLIVISN